MKKQYKTISSFLIIVFVGAMLFSGCGTKKDPLSLKAETSGSKNSANASIQNPNDSSQIKTETKADSTKKIMVIVENQNDYNVKEVQNAMEVLKSNGYINIEIINLDGEQKKSQEVVDKIKKSKPDVIIAVNERFLNSQVVKPLEHLGIPILANTIDEFLDLNGKSLGNITGLSVMPKDMQISAFQLLQKISPINDKKAVFLTAGGMFKKEEVESNLKKVNVALKSYEEINTIEDWQQAVNTYNKDPNIGWMLFGIWPIFKKDGSTIPITEIAKWDVENRHKPTVTYWEAAVQMSIVCGLGVDIPSGGKQLGQMALRILRGEKVENIKVEDPAEINIVLNKKNADALGIEFPADIAGGAYRIYMDYEGHFIENK